MRKIFSIGLVVILTLVLAMGLVGCGDDNENGNNGANTNGGNTTSMDNNSGETVSSDENAGNEAEFEIDTNLVGTWHRESTGGNYIEWRFYEDGTVYKSDRPSSGMNWGVDQDGYLRTWTPPLQRPTMGTMDAYEIDGDTLRFNEHSDAWAEFTRQ